MKGNAKDSWQDVELKDIAEVNARTLDKSYKYELISYVDVASVHKGKVSRSRMSLADAPSRAKRLVRDNDILISTVRPNLKHYAYIPKAEDNLVASTGFATVSSTNSVDPKWLYYYLTREEITNYLSSIADSSTSTFPAFRPEVLQKLKIHLPPLDIQEKVGSVLYTIDQKIELNRRMNEVLEKIGQALFKHYFITNPDRKNWEMKKLSEVAKITIGRTPPRIEPQWFSTNPSDWKWISIKDMGVAKTFITDTSEYLTQSAVERFRVPIIPKGTVIISFKLTMGRVTITDEDMLSNEAIAHLRLNGGNLSVEYLYLFLKNFDFDSLGSTSSIATASNSEAIRSIVIPIPTVGTIREFTKQVEPIFAEILNLTKETKVLTQLRDSLLPRLISGGLKV